MTTPPAKPPCKHVVVQGEWIAKIAALYGFKDWQYVWNASENEALRSRRSRPEQLMPGDEVFVPARRAKKESCEPGSVHGFVIDLGQMAIKVTLKDSLDHAVANTPYELEFRAPGAEGVVPGETNGEGLVDSAVPMNTEHVTLHVPSLKQRIELALGHLDPDREGEQAVRSGMLGRLANLGYAVPADAGEEQERLVILAFQQERMGMEQPTGELDADTCQAIVDAHGS
jgi:hypothetical protein